MRLILEVAQVVAPVFLLAAIGFGWVRRGWAYDVEFVTRLSMTLSIPCLIFMALVRSDVDPRLLRDTVLAALAAYAAVGGIVWALVRALGLDMATYWAPLTFGNTGNLGLPVALFAFGQAGFDFAVVITNHTGIDWDLVVRSVPIVVDTRNACAGVREGRDRIVKA